MSWAGSWRRATGRERPLRLHTSQTTLVIDAADVANPIRDTDDTDKYDDLVVPEAIDGEGVVLRPNEATTGRDYTCLFCKNAVFLRLINGRRLHFVHRSKADTITCVDLRRREREASQHAMRLRREEDERVALAAMTAERAERARIRSIAGVMDAKQRAEHDQSASERWFGQSHDAVVPRSEANDSGVDLWSILRRAERERDEALQRQRASIDAEFIIYPQIEAAGSPDERAVLEQRFADIRAETIYWKQLAEAAEATRLQVAVALRPPKTKPSPTR